MQLTIRFDEQDRTLYAELSDSEEAEEISPSSIVEKLEEVGYRNLTLNPTALSELLANAQQDKACIIALKTLLDATVSVTIANDNRQAFLTLTAPDGGRPLTLDMIHDAIAQAGVPDSLVDHAVVNQCFQQQSVKDICIAQAQLPIPGTDAEFIPLLASETIEPPAVDDHGVADMLNTHRFVVVDVGTPLMKRVPATEGEAGMDVTGKEIKPAPGNDAGFASNLSGVATSPEDPNLLVAAIQGHPVVVNNGVNVDPTLHVDTVDVTTGNITFHGSLEVQGDVAAGMTIDVTGDVMIQGSVEHAIIKAGHSIKVGEGIFGMEDTEATNEDRMEYSLKAGADIEATFVHLATLAAENNVIVKEYMSHSHVKAGNQLLVGQDGGKGIVFGGQCEALHRVAMNQLGNETDIPTRVTAGKLSELSKVYHNLKKELATRDQEANQLEGILQKIQTSEPVVLGKMPLDKTQKIQNTIIAIKEKMARTQDLLHALEPEIELQKKASIHVTRTIHPNTVMTINGTTKRFSERIGGATWVQWGDDLVDHEKVAREKNIKQDAKE